MSNYRRPVPANRTTNVDDSPIGNTYDKYGTTNPLARRLMDGFLASLDASLPSSASSILEVGTGEGEILERLVTRFDPEVAVGLDLPGGDLRDHWRRRGLPMLEADGERLPFPDASFDLVVIVEVLEHVQRPAVVLSEVARVAREHVVLSVPREPIWRVANLARGKYVGALGNTPGHVNHWSGRAFEQLVGTALAVDAVRRPFPWTMVSARAV